MGLYSSTAVCPFCGQPGCPVGAGAAGFLGGFFALLVQDWKGAFKFIRHILFKGKGKIKQVPYDDKQNKYRICCVANKNNSSNEPSRSKLRGIEP